MIHIVYTYFQLAVDHEVCATPNCRTGPSRKLTGIEVKLVRDLLAFVGVYELLHSDIVP